MGAARWRIHSIPEIELVPLARSSTVVEVASGGTRGTRSGPGVWGDDAEEWLQNQTPKK